MYMKRYRILLVLFFVVCGLWIVKSLLPRFVTRSHVFIGTQDFAVEIARSPQELEKGLGDRKELGSDGMLFLLPTRSIPSFWMKGMQFALDFIWIDEGKVVDITANVPPQPQIPDRYLTIYSPRVPVTSVLEVVSGEVKKRGIRIGDQVRFQ
jgi:uncharacterized protein